MAIKRMTETAKITDFFGINVFSDKVMKEYITPKAYQELKDVSESSGELNKELADIVADAMKEWAIANGATHYTHWFQPLTGYTAEKHDAFISIDKEGNTILEFSGKNLSKGEADASSFPSDGIRATFEARGYTVWDCSSPAFIKKSREGAGVLCIPTAFCSYNGEVLDKKTPLLRSIKSLDNEGCRLLRLLGKDVKRVISNVGGEQEYFLIDKKDYMKREDLRVTGRTLFGSKPPKGQEKNDQYYANIKERVLNFMAELNEELWKLGINAKTQHNEAAPSQHELAPIYTTANIATDHNQLIMEMMKKIASYHDLVCLLHEKPFMGINGSGKHDNWSLMTDSGVNLLEPGKSPQENKQFLLFFLSIIAAVDEYSELLRMSAATVGNDFRLGGGEAPPPIISVFIGDGLSEILDNIENGGTSISRKKEYLKIGVSVLPEIKKDYSDRNRTSPFAFTGNKFEFRMVGSSATLSTPNVVMNTIVSEMLSRISEELESIPAIERDAKVSEILVRNIKEHKKVIFNGNNYTQEWYDEAVKRELPIISNSVDAYEILTTDKVVELYGRHKILSKKELESRRDIYLDNYSKTLHIEALTMLSIAKTEILPVVMRYEGELAADINNIKQVNPNCGNTSKEVMLLIDKTLSGFYKYICMLEDAIIKQENIEDIGMRAVFARDIIINLMEKTRKYGDKLEVLCNKKTWPLPSYADMLFYE